MMPSDLFNPEFDGTSFILPGSSTGILLFHGFTATTLEVRSLAEGIHDQLGWSVSAPLLPGHGTTPIDLSHTRNEEWLACANIALKELQSKTDTVFVGGESMGGLLSLYLAATHPEVSGLVLYAPALMTPGMLKARIFKNFVFGSPKRNLTATQPGFLPWQGYKINPLNAVAELGRLQDEVRRHLSEVRQPIIIFQGKQDQTIDPASSRRIMNLVSSVDKRLIEIDECGHCILLDAQHEMVLRESLAFLRSKSMK
jgi:carboxylesterase